jgi:hypothetical protein
MLKARREKTWQMRMSTPGSLLTRTESVCDGPRPLFGAGTGVSVVTMVLDMGKMNAWIENDG